MASAAVLWPTIQPTVKNRVGGYKSAYSYTSKYTIQSVVVVVAVVVFTLNRSFHPTTSAVPPVSFLILHPREIQILWSRTVRQRKTKR